MFFLFSLSSCIILGLILKSLVHFEMIVGWDERRCNGVKLRLLYGKSAFPAPFSLESVLSPVCIFVVFVENQLTVDAWISFLGSSVCFIGPRVCVHVRAIAQYCVLRSGIVLPLVCLFCSNCFGYLGSSKSLSSH